MHTPPLSPRTRLGRTALLVAALLVPAAAGRAQTIVFKDGFTLTGKVDRQKKTIIDPVSNTPIELPDGFFLIDDGARAIIFSPAHLQVVGEKYTPSEVSYKRVMPADSAGADQLPAMAEVLEFGQWDDRWDRLVKFRAADGRTITYNQHVQYLNPVALATDAYPIAGRGGRYKGSVYYLTRELGADGTMALLGMLPELKESRSVRVEDRATHRLKRIQFLIHAGWHEEAAQHLILAARDFPTARAKFEEALKIVRTLQRIDRVADFERAWTAGRHQWTQKQLADFDPTGLPDQTRRRFQALQAKADLAFVQLKDAARLLKAALDGVTLPDQRKLLGEAIEAVLAEVDAETVSRLDTFVTQARQAEQQKKNGAAPELQPPELVALAVTGWLLGNTAAEAKVDVAERLWNSRRMVLAYEAETDAAGRQKILTAWKARKEEVIPLDELAQVIALLPPAEAEAKFSETPTEMTALRSSKCKYHLQLPWEYRHGRSYPVLLVCHAGTESAKEALERWAVLAWENGYILAVPEWNGPVYDFSSEEQLPVLETLRDLRRRFNVDADRVFLAGLGSGADMCYDIAVSHPDLFAGVLPMSGAPAPVVRHCCRNAQFLPFYVVSGDRTGGDKSRDVYADNYRVFRDHWILHKYPMLFVTYKGRGAEYFAEEQRPSFDWMRNKRRVFPHKQLGTFSLGGGIGAAGLGSEFVTLKQSANRFYWLSTDALNPNQVVEGPILRGGRKGGAMQAAIGENTIRVNTVSLKQVTVWLGRDRAGQHMVDLEKPVTVYTGTAQRMKKTVTPSIETMLEDLHERGDRQWLFYARLDFNL